MSQYCVSCKKKISVFSSTPYYLNNDIALCNECAQPLKDVLNKIYYSKDAQEIEALKEEVYNKFKLNCDKTTMEAITEKIDKVCKNLTFSEGEDERVSIEKEYLKSKYNNMKNHMLTTGYDFQGYLIKKYIGVFSGQVVLGTGFLSELSASFSDFFGDESTAFADKIEKAKNSAIKKLIEKSYNGGGNAVIGVDFDYITFQNNMIGVIATGTSVVIERIADETISDKG